MAAPETAAHLTRFERRGAGTNAERRAALWLRDEVASAQREASVETFWCRPQWALAYAWHVLLAVAGSLVMVSNAPLGGALVAVALLCTVLDSVTGYSPGRRLTPERASQNVVSQPAGSAPNADREPTRDRVRLILTANYDAGRTGLAYRPGCRRVAARARRVLAGGRLTPGWVGWLVIENAVLILAAVLRKGGSTGVAVDVLQLIPTVVLVLELALLLELALAPHGPAAGDNAAGTAVAIALARALDAAPPRRLVVELVLQGAGDGGMLGLTSHLRGRRRELGARNAVVLGIGPCGAGVTHWWTGDGTLLALRFHPRLRRLAADLAAPDQGLDARPYRGRGVSPALPARRAGLPAITLGCLDERGLAPRSHQPDDHADALDRAALDALLHFSLMLVDALDAELLRGDRGHDLHSGRP